MPQGTQGHVERPAIPQTHGLTRPHLTIPWSWVCGQSLQKPGTRAKSRGRGGFENQPHSAPIPDTAKGADPLYPSLAV